MKKQNPWQVYDTRVVYENPWIRVREDKVVHPDGHKGIYGVVDALCIATGVVALTTDDEVYLVGQYRYPINLYSWEIIEGGSKEGEEPLEAIKRELREEAGIIARDWVQLGSEFYLSNCFSSEVGYVFLARDLEVTEADPDDSEVLEIKTVPFIECLDMVDSGAITDAVSIVGLLRADRYFKSLKT